MNVSEWINSVINGTGGMNSFEEHELVVWHDTERVCAATWAIRCLANPFSEGSGDVLQAIIERREEILERARQRQSAFSKGEPIKVSQ